MKPYSIAHNELCFQTLWLCDGLPAALVGLWGATGPEEDGDYLLENGMDDFDHDLPVPYATGLVPSNAEGPTQDIFNWTTPVYTLMNNGQEPLDDLREREGVAAVIHAVKAKEFPCLARDLLGDFAPKAWKGEYQDAQALYEELQVWLEEELYR